MTDIKEILSKELKKSQKLIKKAERSLADAPPGNLRISKSNNSYQYYFRETPDSKNGTYIPAKNRAFAAKLAQKEYDLKILKEAQAQAKALRKFLAVYNPGYSEQTYLNLHPARQSLVHPYDMPIEEFISQWSLGPSCANPFSDDTPVFITERGEHVRSKSEKILADRFFSLGIPYLYEIPLRLPGYGTVYPDFLLLNMSTRQEYYWEHLGKMGDPSYCARNIKKLEHYQQCGIFPGKNLLLTFETSEKPLNMQAVDDLIREYLV